MDSEKSPTTPFAQAALDIALARRQAAQAQRDNADALEKAAKALDREAQAALAAHQMLQAAREQARARAQQLRESAANESTQALLQGLGAQNSSGAVSVAVQFENCGLAATRRSGADRSSWKKGLAFELIPEPTNPHDPNAIKVLIDGKPVGYLAKDDAQRLAKMRSKDGWELGERAYLVDRKGGKWDEGIVAVRMQNPIMGWAGFNPGLSMQENIVAMERELFASLAPEAPKSRAPSL